MNFLLLTTFFVYTFIISFLIHKFLINRSKKYNIHKANTNTIRWEQQSKAILGGITFYTIFIFSIINSLLITKSDFITSPISLVLILSITISFLMGMADDILNTPPSFKFIVQLGVAFIMLYFGIYINLFSSNILNYGLTILWVVGIMNSINMLDNMDAITSSVSTIIFIFFGIIVALVAMQFQTFFMIIILGATASLVSFLIFNWHPSKIYMGDNGSQFLGAILAILGVLLIWNFKQSTLHYSTIKTFVAIALTFSMPLIDTTTVSINRILKGHSPFIGGKDHTTHFLSYLGLKDNQVALFFIASQTISIILAYILLFHIENASITTLMLFMLWPILVFIFLYSLTKIIKPNK